MYPTTARRWMTDGAIITVPDASGVSRRYARLSDVPSHRDRLVGRIPVPDLAEALEIAHHAFRLLGLDVEQHPTSRQYHLTPETADAPRAEHQRIQDLRRRSMKLAAARQLKDALSTAVLLSRTGQLDVDPESDSSGARFVTRTSVEATGSNTAERAHRAARAGRRSARWPASRARANRRPWTWCASGALVQMPGTRRRTITAGSLQAWLAGTDRP